MKLNKIYLPILFFSCIAFGIVIGSYFNFPIEKPSFVKNNSKSKLNRLLNFIDNEYVDDVKTDSIVDITVNSILANLDPHSVYIPKAEQAFEAESMRGDFVGIGVNFYVYNDTVAVIKPIENGPAELAGIKAGDRILFADKFKLFGKKIETDTLYNKLRGKVNSNVLLTVYRKSENKKFNINVSRDVVPIKSVDTHLQLDDKTGYIKINRFAESTAREFHEALVDLKQKSTTNLVIDLRGNGGGLMEQAIEIADELLKNKELIVFTKNKKGTIDKTYGKSGGIFENGKLFILIDESSASASEILAGAIQDNDRGIIVGRRSFGKGLVQREMDFDDGSAVRLTIARYYTPSGRSIQKPYVKGHSEEYFNEFDARFDSGELYEKDKIKIADSLKFKTKNGRIVYGGGGIVPDVFVPLESNHELASIEYVLKTGILGHFVFEELDKDRNSFKNLSIDKVIEKINNNDIYVKKLKIYLLKTGFEIDFKNSTTMAKRYIAAEFISQLYGENEYYKIILKEDKMIKSILK